MATLTDAFTRADTAPGGGLGTLPSGPVWQTISGDWYISSQAAAQSSVSNAVAAVDLGAADVDLSVSIDSGGLDSSSGLVLRAVDASNYLAVRAGAVSSGGVYQYTTVYLTRVQAGVATVVAGPFNVGTPQAVDIRVVAAGSSIDIYARGTLRGSVTESTFATATKHGLIKNPTPFGGAQNTLDNFSVTYNTAPNAPVLVSPVGAVTIDSTSGQRLDWTFSDSDFGDSQSKYDLRYRLVGAAAWTDLTGTTTATHRDVAAGFFADGDYEWQVRTYDAVGLVGPYSASGFFTVATPPPGPSITDPVNGQTISAETYTVTWSAPDQDAYQLRVVADDGAGAPDETTVRYDTGTVTSTAARSASVPFPTNNITEHIQLRVQDGGLWSSPYTTVWVDVSYTPPAVSTLTLTTDDATGSIGVNIDNPAPGAGEPTVESHDIYRRVSADGGDGIRVVTGLVAGGTWTDYTPASGVDYDYRVVSFGDNGTSSTSDWTADAEPAPDPDVLIDGGAPDTVFA